MYRLDRSNYLSLGRDLIRKCSERFYYQKKKSFPEKQDERVKKNPRYKTDTPFITL